MVLLMLGAAFLAICFAVTTKESRAGARDRQRKAGYIVGLVTAAVWAAIILPELFKR